jgi:hypothetical protein
LSEEEARQGIELLNKTASQLEVAKTAQPWPQRMGSGGYGSEQLSMSEGVKP